MHSLAPPLGRDFKRPKGDEKLAGDLLKGDNKKCMIMRFANLSEI